MGVRLKMETALPLVKTYVRWPVVEICLLMIFPIPFVGPDALQRIYGHLPHLIQEITPFLIGGFVVVSALLLTLQGIRARSWGHVAASIACTIMGVASVIYTIAIMRALSG